MSTEKSTAERFIIEYDDDGECFYLFAPSQPHRSGGTSRHQLAAFGEEGDAQQACNNLNDWLASAPSLKQENEELKERIEELTPSHPPVNCIHCGVPLDVHGTCCGWINASHRIDSHLIIIDERHPGFGQKYLDWITYSEPSKLRSFINTLFDQAIALSKEGKLPGTHDEYVFEKILDYVTKSK